jgi:sugar transferase EpsL
VSRIFNLFLLFLFLPIIGPLFLVIALVVRFDVGSPVFFKQDRGGYKNSVFALWKFRTMTDQRDETGALLPDAERLTRIGKLLRTMSLDELPSLYNVLVGDIAIVGPRPFIADYLRLYTEAQRRRHDVLPGITGWAQVQGRNTLTWDEKFELDLWYVDNRSFWLDIKILFRTVHRVLARDGVSAEEHVTMPRFDGSV